jgi:long-chain acyl-CoA synthetase
MLTNQSRTIKSRVVSAQFFISFNCKRNVRRDGSQVGHTPEWILSGLEPLLGFVDLAMSVRLVPEGVIVMSVESQTLRDLLENSARLYAGRQALAMVDGPQLTYRELWERVGTLSAFLHEHGTRHGDRVALLGENMPNWGVAYFAITTIGAVAVPILPDFPAEGIARIIRHAEADIVFVSRRLVGKLAELAPEEIRTTILLDNLSIVHAGAYEKDLEPSNQQSRPAAPSSDTSVSAEEAPAVSPDDLAEIVYTSGTTGHSKGVMLTHGNLVAEAKATVGIADVRPDDKLLSILPLAHTYECTIGLITPMSVGASVHYLDKPPTAAVLLPALEKLKPTVMLSVPLIIEKIYKSKILPQLTASPLLRQLHNRAPFRKILHRFAGKKLLEIFGGELRIFAIGGAPLAPDVELFLREARFPYAIGYGLTETAPLVAGAGPAVTRYRSTGPTIHGTQIRIAKPNLENGEGEIQVKGPTVMKGYYRDPERTRDAFTEDGWLKTGDLGVFDAEGYLYIKGRSKNMILGPSGKNIYPEEIEAIINEFDSVQESLVYEQGNRLVALVHLDYERLQKALHSFGETDFRVRMNTLLADLHKQINTRIPLYARIHKLIEHSEPFQKTPTQKIKRHLYTR